MVDELGGVPGRQRVTATVRADDGLRLIASFPASTRAGQELSVQAEPDGDGAFVASGPTAFVGR